MAASERALRPVGHYLIAYHKRSATLLEIGRFASRARAEEALADAVRDYAGDEGVEVLLLSGVSEESAAEMAERALALP